MRLSISRSIPRAILLLLLAGHGGRALLGGTFEVKPSKELSVLHGGRLLLASDDIPGYPPGWKAGQVDVRKVNGTTVVNTTCKDSDTLRYRRELGVAPGRVELTVKARLLPYKTNPSFPTLAYVFRIPWDRLKNTTWKALVGKVASVKVRSGRFGKTRPSGRVLSRVRYIAFRGKETRLVVDLNPKGLFTRMNFGQGGFLGLWYMTKRGDFIEFSCGFHARFHGGVLGAKVLIYEGEYAFDKMHAMKRYTEFGALPMGRNLCFGAAAAPAGWEAVGPRGAASATWRDAASVAYRAGKGKALLAAAAAGKGGNALTVAVTPGVYFVTIRTGKVPSGPFDVKLNGKIEARGVVTRPDAPTKLYLSSYCRDGKMRVEFITAATWAVSTISLQPMITAYEDFAFDRGPWLVEGVFTPEG